jgi:hypothetical protein
MMCLIMIYIQEVIGAKVGIINRVCSKLRPLKSELTQTGLNNKDI